MFKRILLPVDPARAFAAANQYAVDLARRYGCDMVATYVIDEHLIGHSGAEAAATLDDALEWVGTDAIEDFASHHPELRIQRTIAYGSTATALFQMVLQSGADLVVVGGYHSTAAPHIWGSTVADVVQHVERPVFVVRSAASLPKPGEPILVPYDGSRPAMAALPKIAAFARDLDAGIEMVYAARGKQQETAEAVLEQGREIASQSGVPTSTAVLRCSVVRPKWRAIVARAAEIRAPLIALARLGSTSMRTGRSRTVTQLVGHADVPVWVVRK